MRHMGIALTALAVFVALPLVVVGCGGTAGGGVSPPAGAADITGPIKTLTVAGSDRSFLIVADPAVAHDVDRALVRVTAHTSVWAPVGEGRRSLTAADLRVGQRVAVRIAGPLAESWPPQGTAADVEIISPL